MDTNLHESDPPQCPICSVALSKDETSGDLMCPDCQREWYPCEVDGEASLASRRRKVRIDITELREGGDIRKAIRPV